MAQLSREQTMVHSSEQHNSENIASTFTVNDLEPVYRAAFPKLTTFNKIQTTVAKTVLQTGDSIVINAPTGSGKTVILELAILKLATETKGSYRIVYLAPTRSLCAEKYHDWKARFTSLGINCIQFDGDNMVEDSTELVNYRLILSTPEKWEVFTRHWDDQSVATVLHPIKLFLIDEIQVMSDSERGANLELVVSRMKYLDSRLHREQLNADGTPESIRFIAVSACIPNVDDFAQWLKSIRNVAPFTFDETNRTTKIARHVIGYPCTTNTFMFEQNLNYKLPAIIEQYSCQKPTLIFCTSRKSVETTARFLARSNMKRIVPAGPMLHELAGNLANKTLQDCVTKGVAYHHAGLLHNDRSLIEQHFRRGHIAVLCCTSTLCMGVNLPAYLVIVKSTFNHAGKDYSDNYLLQMIGRAGRAEFSEDGVAVILTSDANVVRYRKTVSGMAPVESQLHRKLPELLNSEVAHGIIYDQPAVMEWMRSTFFYVRGRINPTHYKLTGGRNIEEEMSKLCTDTIASLEESGLIVNRRPNAIVSTPCGRLMARNQLSFQTMKLLQADLKGTESLQEMLALITRANEFNEYKCRQSEKKVLNALNASRPSKTNSFCEGADEEAERIRFPLTGRISTTGGKVYCLVQAMFGNLAIHDHGLHQEAAKIVTLGARIARFIVGLLAANQAQYGNGCFQALVSVTSLLQSFQTKLWKDSPFLSKQLGQIGSKLARHLADRGKVTFRAIRDADPREIECILKKQPPVGNDIVSFVSGLPEFSIELTKTDQEPATFSCTIAQKNTNYDPEISVSFSVLVGDSANRILLHQDKCTMENIPVMGCTWPLVLKDTAVEYLSAHLICHNWTGFDSSHTLYLVEQPQTTKHRQTTITNFFPNQSANESMLGIDAISIPPAQEFSRLNNNVSLANEPLGLDWTIGKSFLNATASNDNIVFENTINIPVPAPKISLGMISSEQGFPLRSILKAIPRCSLEKPPTIDIPPANLSESNLSSNDSSCIQPEPIPRVPKSLRAKSFFQSDDFKNSFQSERCTLSFALCGPLHDIVDCFRRYNIFIEHRETLPTPSKLPIDEIEPILCEERRVKKFDLGSAADVFGSDVDE